ncbi:MAG: hypothetical protein ACPHER_05510, partial [Nevskiales bacterium]
MAPILLSIIFSLPGALANAAELDASFKDRVIIKYQGEEITVPIPAGYELSNFRRLQLGSLPQLQERHMLAAFVPIITPNNEYSVAPEPGHSRPSYYLVYRPRLESNPGDAAELLTKLEKQFYEAA